MKINKNMCYVNLCVKINYIVKRIAANVETSPLKQTIKTNK